MCSRKLADSSASPESGNCSTGPRFAASSTQALQCGSPGGTTDAAGRRDWRDDSGGMGAGRKPPAGIGKMKPYEKLLETFRPEVSFGVSTIRIARPSELTSLQVGYSV